ncbi:MAG: tyrosine-type recombinase/integrase [Parvibaculaceae bacterium]
MIQMTHLTWRQGRAVFRYRLPPELRAIPKPKHWPPELAELVSEAKPHQLKHELSKAIGTRDERTAKREASKLVGWAEDLVAEAIRLLKQGPRRSLSAADIEAMAANYGASLISSDLELRKKGIGLDFSVGAKLRIGPPPPREPGLSNDDLGLLRFAVERVGPELREAMARQRVPDHVKEAVNAALGEAGIDLPSGASERRELELAFLEQRLKALQVMDARNKGEIVVNPTAPQKAGAGPTIQEAFEAWKTGVGARGEKLPKLSTIQDGDYVTRRFREQFGNLRIAEITPSQARSFRDALVRIPPRLSQKLQRLPLPKLIEHPELPLSKPAAGTVNKKLQVMSAIMNSAARRFDLKSRPGGWTDPFEGLKLHEAKSAAHRRATFAIDDLKIIFSQPFVIEGDTSDGGGKGLAARWIPLVGLFTGARRGEIAQLKVGDVQVEGEIPFFRITDLGEGQQVKNIKSIRRVPLHPELVKCGFLNFVRGRKDAVGQEGWLLDGLKKNQRGDRGDAWGRWFGHQLHDLGINKDGRKVFHSFRHTFIAWCREAGIEEEVRFALTGHSSGSSVGRGYGADESGYRFSLERLQREIAKVRYPGLDLRQLHQHSPAK